MNIFLKSLGSLGKNPLVSLPLGIAVGIIVLILGVVWIRLPQAIASSYWPTADGVIINSFVRDECCNSYTEGFYAEVSYRYSVNQRVHTSDKIQLIGRLFTINNIDYFERKIVDKYPTGKKVMVYYNPKNPEDAVLEPGLTITMIVLSVIVLIIAFTPVGIGLSVRSLGSEESKLKNLNTGQLPKNSG